MFDVCSNNLHLKSELVHIKKVFREINGYPNWAIEQIIKKVISQNKIRKPTQTTTHLRKQAFVNITLLRECKRNNIKLVM